MIYSSAVRFIRLIVISVISSALIVFLTEYFDFYGSFPLLISFALFAVIIGMDTFIFSMYYRKKIDAVVGLFIPYGIYIAISLLLYFAGVSPSAYNYIFLPMRSMEFFYVRSVFSIIFVHILMLALIFTVRIFGVRHGIKVRNALKREALGDD